MNRYSFLLIFAVLLVGILFLSSCNGTSPPLPTEKTDTKELLRELAGEVEVIQTDGFVTFLLSRKLNPYTNRLVIRAVQLRAEKWQTDNENMVTGFSTSQGAHFHFIYCMTLSIQKK